MTTFTSGPAMAMRNSSIGFSGMRSSRATPPIGSSTTSGVTTPKMRAVKMWPNSCGSTHRNTSRMKIRLFQAAAQRYRIPEEPWEEFLIAIAGPLVTVAITIALVLFAGAHLQPAAAAAVDNLKIPLVDRLAAVNLFLALFNLIPAFPMDGGRVLRALLASRLGYVRATGIAAAIGQFVAFALGFLGLLYNPILIFIAIFVYLAASSEAHMVALRAVSRGVPVTHAMVTQFATLSPQAHIDEAVETLLKTSQGEFPVVDADGKPVGVLGRGDIIRAIKTFGPVARVTQAMNVELPTIGHRRCLEDAFKLLQEKSAPAVGVTDAAGKLVGLITGETIAEMMMLQDAMPNGARAGPWGRPAAL